MTGSDVNNPSYLATLGMGAAIERRDILRGIGFAAAASTLPAAAYSSGMATPYPPALTGLRGSTDASFQAAHNMRDGGTWRNPSIVDEPYDLIVVGAGISGLSAAHLFRKQMGSKVRILILDNHDDFGGHARRNEHSYNGRTFLSPGGSVFVRDDKYDADLLSLIDLSVEDLKQAHEHDIRFKSIGLKSAIYFDKRTYGEDRTVVANILPLGGQGPSGEFRMLSLIDRFPISAKAKQELKHFLGRREDVLAGKSDQEKEAYLASISYDTFLTKYGGLSREAANLFARFPASTSAATSDCISALTGVQRQEMPGFHLLGEWGGAQQKAQNRTWLGASDKRAGPEGNAFIARSLVWRLLRHACPADSLQSLETARIDYGALDKGGTPVRLRLNSTVVNVRQGAGGRAPVKVTYIKDGKPYLAEASKCVLACYNMLIPYIAPDLPEAQRAALSYNVKVPLLAASVLLRTGQPFAKLGAGSFYSPGRVLHEQFAWCRSFGNHRQDYNPDDPTVMYMIAPPINPHSGMTPRDQYRAARAELLEKPFEAFEFDIREHLHGLFAGTGFDAARDIVSLTLNRWGHGYSYTPNSLFDGPFKAGELPFEVARKPFGSIAIANSDSAMEAAAIKAIEQAARAVREVA